MNSKEWISIKKVSIITLSKYVLLYFQWPIIFVMMIILLTLFIGIINGITLFGLMNQFIVILFIGIILSNIIHEYMHLLFMKLFGGIHVMVDTTILKFSISVNESIIGIKLVIVAISGSFSCALIAGILYIISVVWIEQRKLCTKILYYI